MDIALKAVSNRIGDMVNHHRNLDENMNKLKRKHKELNCRKEDVESRKKIELLQPRKKLKKEVELWLDNVEEINVEIQSIEEKHIDITWSERARLSEQVAQKTQEVEELHQKGCFSDSLVVDEPPRKGAILPTSKLAGENTAVRKLEEIWVCLINDDVGKIGVYGMGGSGKTTIMKHINNRILKERHEFNSVIWVTVSKKLNVRKIQNAIASVLHLDISKFEDEKLRAAELLSLLRKKRYMLILDDMWEAFPLELVGIPEPTPDNGCKIVLTTRSLNVCKQMDCKDIKMELLSKEEAWKLFLDIVGDDVLKTPGLKETAKRVAEECACLPLAVITIAGSMKGIVDLCEWRHVLEKLKEYSTKGLKEMRLVLGQLKYSYHRLEDEVHRRCLLYCALYPEDFAIQRYELIDLLIVEGIIDGMKSRQAQLDKGHSILNKLEKVCLLERAQSNELYSHTGGPNSGEFVKMHDLIRDMALEIMGGGSMVEAGVGLRDLPDDEHWTEDLEWVSLMINNISEIRNRASPRCGRLSTLFLLRNRGLRRIPDSFFVHMSGLKVLNLSYTGIVILPDKISDMVNLTALLLRRCSKLKNVPSLANLGALKALDLSYTGIEEVPQGLEMLVSLNYLNLFTESLKTFPTGILPRLSRLQYLIFDTQNVTSSKVKGEDVASLTKLESFKGKFYNLHDFNIYVRSLQGKRLRNYSLEVGEITQHLYTSPSKIELIQKKDEVNGCKYVGLGQCFISSRENPVVIPEDCCHLEIKECHDMSSLSDVLSSKHDFLKRCFILKCDGIECVISLSSSACTPLGSLEELHLMCLRNLRTICKVGASPLPPHSISCLKHFHMSYCPNMKKLFTPRLVPYLQNLETIHVSSCKGMEEIIAAADDEREGEGEGEGEGGVGESSNRSIGTVEASPSPPLPPGTFSCLKKLYMFKCPNVKKLFTPRLLPHLQNLESIDVSDCDGMEEIIGAADDEREEGEGGVGESSNRSIDTVEASPSPPLPPGTFSCLKKLYMFKCPNMKKLFTPRLLPHLQNLESIEVLCCDGMEEIIAATDDEREAEGEGGVGESSNRSIANNDDTTTSITLPKLRKLSLNDLPKLKTIVSSRAVMVCDSLVGLTVRKCPELKRLPLSLPMPNGQTSPFPSLKRIILLDREWLESLESDQPIAKEVLQS